MKTKANNESYQRERERERERGGRGRGGVGGWRCFLPASDSDIGGGSRTALFLEETPQKWRGLVNDASLRVWAATKDRGGGTEGNNVAADPFVSHNATKGSHPVVSAVRREYKGTQPDTKDNQSFPQSIAGIAFSPLILWLIWPARQDTKTPIGGQIIPVWVGFTDVCTGLVIRRELYNKDKCYYFFRLVFFSLGNNHHLFLSSFLLLGTTTSP